MATKTIKISEHGFFSLDNDSDFNRPVKDLDDLTFEVKKGDLVIFQFDPNSNKDERFVRIRIENQEVGPFDFNEDQGDVLEKHATDRNVQFHMMRDKSGNGRFGRNVVRSVELRIGGEPKSFRLFPPNGKHGEGKAGSLVVTG